MIASSDHWLFVCTSNYVRSPTAEYVARRNKLLADSCGAPPRKGAFCVKLLTQAHIAWANLIVCMEERHVAAVKAYPLKPEQKVYCWNLPDDWGSAYDPQLVEVCEKRLSRTITAWHSGRELRVED